jgi:hypothetical protein
MCITRQLGHKFKFTVDDFFDPFSQKPLYVERVVECRYVSSATKNFGVSLVPVSHGRLAVYSTYLSKVQQRNDKVNKQATTVSRSRAI